MCHQTNLRFYADIAYDKQYKGLILDGFEGDSLLNIYVVPTVGAIMFVLCQCMQPYVNALRLSMPRLLLSATVLL